MAVATGSIPVAPTIAWKPRLTRTDGTSASLPVERHGDRAWERRRLNNRPIALSSRVFSYCIVDRGVGTMRWIFIFSRSRQSGTRGAILVFQWSVSYTALYCASRSASLWKRRIQI